MSLAGSDWLSQAPSCTGYVVSCSAKVIRFLPLTLEALEASKIECCDVAGEGL